MQTLKEPPDPEEQIERIGCFNFDHRTAVQVAFLPRELLERHLHSLHVRVIPAFVAVIDLRQPDKCDAAAAEQCLLFETVWDPVSELLLLAWLQYIDETLWFSLLDLG